VSPLRNIRRFACLVLIVALLFAQAAFAARPCIDPDMSAAAAVAAQSEGGCCDTAVAEIKLCAVQCADGNKLPGPRDRSRFTACAPFAAESVTIQPFTDHVVASAQWQRLQRDHIADPPSALRFCRLLI
jgi:hypothetical protein